MSQTPGVSPDSQKSNGLPAWISAGVLGVVLGAGGAVLALHDNSPKTAAAKTADAGSPAAMTRAGTGAGAPAMGMGGGGGGGGGANGKRALTQLIGKLELLSRPTLTLRVELSAEQANAIAAKLLEFDKSESMSAEEAQANSDALEGLLTPEQKDALAAIGLPGGRGGRGGGGMGGGPPSNPNENPFTQEANHKRLHDLLARIAPASVEEETRSNRIGQSFQQALTRLFGRSNEIGLSVRGK